MNHLTLLTKLDLGNNEFVTMVGVAVIVLHVLHVCVCTSHVHTLSVIFSKTWLVGRSCQPRLIADSVLPTQISKGTCMYVYCSVKSFKF